MTDARSKPSDAAPDCRGTIVRRPLASDAIGAALNRAFTPRQTMPGDFSTMLSKLDANA